MGLVLTGGGARGAYQAGVIRGIQDVCKFKQNPFQIVSGISAGAINGAWLAARSQDFDLATRSLWEAWSQLNLEKVFHTDTVTLFGTGSMWVRDLTLGAWFGRSNVSYLLDTRPLAHFLAENIDLNAIDMHLRDGTLEAFAISATHYRRGEAITFYQSRTEYPPWVRGARRGQAAIITTRHILASAAIPIFFPPVKLDDGYYGDGGVRMVAPISPPIHLGADRVLAIGISPGGGKTAGGSPDAPILPIDIAGTLLNALFFDALDFDALRMDRINRTLSVMTPKQLEAQPDRLRQVPILVIRPSVDLGSLASQQFSRFPYTLRHLLKGLGASQERGWELLSYLAFDPVYAESLLELGYSDALKERARIQEFFRSPPGLTQVELGKSA